jgi:hypothetical protein
MKNGKTGRRTIMAIIDTIMARAKADVRHIVLPEGEEKRGNGSNRCR